MTRWRHNRGSAIILCSLLFVLVAHPTVEQRTALSPEVVSSLPEPIAPETLECGTDREFAFQFGLQPRFAIADNMPLGYQVIPPVLKPNRTEDFRIVFEVVGDVSTLKFHRFDTSETGSTLETWERTTTRSVDGRLISVFDRTFPANVLDPGLRFFHGYDFPMVPIGEIERPGSVPPNPDGTPGTPVRQRLFVRLAPSNLPESEVRQFDLSQTAQTAVEVQAAQYASHVVNLHIPSFGDERVMGGDQAYDRQGVVQAFLQHVKDEYDNVAIIPEKSAFESWGGFWNLVRNDVQGINLPLTDQSSAFGSNGTLRGTQAYRIGQAFVPETFLHETAHQYGARYELAAMIGAEGGGHEPTGHMALLWPGRTMIGAVLQASHGVVKSADVSGGRTLAGSDFEIERPDGPHTYHPLQLYRMGHKPASEVSDLEVFDNQKQFDPERASKPDAGTKLQGNTQTVTMNDIQGKYGMRSDLVATHWRVGFVVVTRDGLLSQEEMNWFNFYTQRMGADSGTTSYNGYPSYKEATGGKATLTTDINPRTAQKINQGLSVSFPSFGTTDWRGIVLDGDFPAQVSTGQRLTISGSVDAAIHGGKTFDRLIVRFVRYRDTGAQGITAQTSVTNGRFSFDATVPQRPGRYSVEFFLFEPGQTIGGADTDLRPVTDTADLAVRRELGRGACLLACASLVMCVAPAEQTARVRVELHVDQTRTDHPASFVLPVDTVAVVRGLGTDDAATLASVSATAALAELRDALGRDARPAASAPLELPLRTAAEWSGVAWDIVVFGDDDADGAWSAGEPYVAAWTGGRGAYRLVYLSEPDAQHPGAGIGWNLLEGGQPRTYHPDPAEIVISLNPIEEPVVGR